MTSGQAALSCIRDGHQLPLSGLLLHLASLAALFAHSVVFDCHTPFNLQAQLPFYILSVAGKHKLHFDHAALITFTKDFIQLTSKTSPSLPFNLSQKHQPSHHPTSLQTIPPTPKPQPCISPPPSPWPSPPSPPPSPPTPPSTASPSTA